MPAFCWNVLMMRTVDFSGADEEALSFAPVAAGIPLAPAAAPGREVSRLLLGMFRDPDALDAGDRRHLIAQLRAAVKIDPDAAETRALLSMVLYIDVQTQEALEQMREAVRRSPDCFIARLKLGEMLMRLRNCDQAAEETQKAAQLASNAVQSDLARNQSAAIDALMQQDGVRSHKSLLLRVIRAR